MDCGGSSGAEGMLGQRSSARGGNAQCRIIETGLISTGVCTKEGCAAFLRKPHFKYYQLFSCLKLLSTTLKGAVLAVNITPNEVMQ